MDKYNSVATSKAQRVQKFCILDGDFSVPGGELTGTQKLKRPIVNKKYASGGCNRYFLRNERNKSYFAIPIPKVVDKDFVKFSSLKSVMHILTPSPILNILQRNRGLSIAALARRLISEGQVRTS